MRDYHLLLADESQTVKEMLSYVCSSAGYSVETAENGIDALRAVLRRIPDLVLIDIRMPKLSGTQVCRILKEDPATRDVPVILTTSRKTGPDRVHALQSGADKVLVKDSDPGEILRAAEECLVGRAPRPEGKREEKATFPDDMEILLRANEILESNLLDTVLYNEVGRVGREVEDFDSTVRTVARFLLEIMSHEAMAVVFYDGVFLEKVIVYHYQTNERIRQEAAEWTEKFCEEAGVPVALRGSRVIEILLEGKRMDGARHPELLHPRIVCPIRSGEMVRGILAFLTDPGDSSLTEGTPDEDLFKYSFTALENAWLYRQISRVSVTDGLTGLFNHRHFLECLKREHFRSLRYRAVFSLLMIDIDHFKKINDVFGHPTGDQVLRELADILREGLRSMDLPARYGGEEFAVLLPETNEQDAQRVSERLRQAIERKVFAAPTPLLHCTVSIGVSAFDPESAVSEGVVLERADKALYEAKRQGRNRVCVR